jgi:rare lipoprotein A
MNYRVLGKFALAVALSVGLNAGSAHARSGKAAYHLHTSSMVTAARHERVGSILRVTNPKNGRSVIVRVNDRGPFNGGRILDLSTGAFRKLFGSLNRGVGPITYTVIKRA